MDLLTLSGVLMILGFGLLVLNMLLAPPRLYQETDTEVRLQIIADHRFRWIFAQVTGALGPLLTAIGFLLLAIHFQEVQSSLLLNIGAAAFILGAVSMMLYTFQSLSDPGAYLTNTKIAPVEIAGISLTSAGGILFGITFLQSSIPNWLGYLTIGSAVLLFTYLLLKGSLGYLMVILFYLVTLIVGTVLVLQ